MNRFNQYKNINLVMKIRYGYYRVFNTPMKRILLNSIVAFCFGSGVACGALFIAGNVNVEKGIGGLETSGRPEFETYVDDSAVAVSESSEAKTAVLASVTDAAASTATEADSLDAASEVLSQDSYSSNGLDLELCYVPYRVKKGDMIGYIADQFGITQDTIISVNNIHQSRLIQIGQYLKIPTMPGIVYTVRKDGETVASIAEKYEVSAGKCSRVNHIDETKALAAGTSLFVPDAQLDWVTRQEINGDLFHKPLHARYWLSSAYGWRESPFSGKRSFHSGVDMAAPTGTSIYAALGGTVTSVGFNNVYGNYVIVTHHSGYKTLYGHMSAILATRGQYVDTNTRIGKVGSTGLSTGPHLHFTVYKFGKTVNPITLWR